MRFLLLLLCWPVISLADTINNYISISNTIPKMEMRADAKAQTWARSARHVLTITDETIAETLLQANELAKNQGHALFCLPAGIQLTAQTVHDLINKTYQAMPSQQSDKDKMTISQIAWLGVIKMYPCQGKAAALIPALR